MTGASSDFFGSDYAYFYEAVQTPQRAEREADLLVELLELQPSARIVDLACGYGRIAVRLARRGMRVTGIDLNAAALRRAAEIAREQGVSADFRQADYRALADVGCYEGAVCWFTSFGFHSESVDRDTLHRVACSLVRGGRFALEVVRHDAIVETLSTDRSFPVVVSEVGEDVILDRLRLAQDFPGISMRRIIRRDGQFREARITIRSFRPRELCDWLLDAGFSKAWEHSLSPHHRDLFTQWSMVIVAER